MKKRAKHEYVVGYKPDGNCVYGKNEYGCVKLVQPMTRFQAMRYQRDMPCDGARIFRLVDVTDEVMWEKGHRQ